MEEKPATREAPRQRIRRVLGGMIDGRVNCEMVCVVLLGQTVSFFSPSAVLSSPYARGVVRRFIRYVLTYVREDTVASLGQRWYFTQPRQRSCLKPTYSKTKGQVKFRPCLLTLSFFQTLTLKLISSCKDLDTTTMATDDLEQLQLMRSRLDEATADGLQYLGQLPPSLRETTVDIPGTSQHAIITYPPAASASSSTTKHPLIILFYGGGFMAGTPQAVLSPARGYAQLLNAIVACPSYALAPEHPFPASAHSAWHAVAWLSNPENLHPILNGQNENDNNNKVEFDPQLGLVLAGVSAGANLATVIASLADPANAPLLASQSFAPLPHPITGVFAAVPLLLHRDMPLPDAYKALWTSQHASPDTPIMTAAALEGIQQRVKPDLASPWWSPLAAGGGTLCAPRRVYLCAGERDLLRDDAVVYERALRDKGGTETRLEIVKDGDHAAWCTVPWDEAHSTEMRLRSLDGMAWLLGKEWDQTEWKEKKKLPY